MTRLLGAGWLLLTLLCAAGEARAGACPLAASASGSCGCTVGTGSTTCLNAKTSPGYREIVVDNESTTATIACTDDGTTPALNTAGSYTIPPGMTRTWLSGPNITYQGPLNCLAGAASTPATVKGQ